MSGEIRDKMAQLRQTRQRMVGSIAAEIDKVIDEFAATETDGLKAMELPRAELQGYRTEIQEIRAEFAPLTNGAPADPLPGSNGTEKASPPSVAASVAATPKPAVIHQPALPDAGWRPLPEAPRADANGNPRPIKLLLPVGHTDANGRTLAVAPVEIDGVWDRVGQHWIDRATGQRVYPSLWKPL